MAKNTSGKSGKSGKPEKVRTNEPVEVERVQPIDQTGQSPAHEGLLELAPGIPGAWWADGHPFPDHVETVEAITTPRHEHTDVHVCGQCGQSWKVTRTARPDGSPGDTNAPPEVPGTPDAPTLPAPATDVINRDSGNGADPS